MKYVLTFLMLMSNLAFASDYMPEDEITEEEVRAAMDNAEKEYSSLLNKLEKPENHTQNVTYQDGLRKKKNASLDELASQVDALKNKLVIQKTTLLATQSPRKVKVLGRTTIFNYDKSSIYEITSAVDHVTDIALKEGENITTTPTAGDTVRWNLSVMKSGNGGRAQTHIIVKPLDTNIETNLIITTDQNIYHINLKSGDFHMPSVAWNYPMDEKIKFEDVLNRRKNEEATINPVNLCFNYEIEGKNYNWKPIRVFDDGSKTYIQMPRNLKVTEAPVLFLLDDKKNPLIVNYRVKGDLYIIDRLIEKAELRVGHDKAIKISLDDGKNFFQRLFF